MRYHCSFKRVAIFRNYRAQKPKGQLSKYLIPALYKLRKRWLKCLGLNEGQAWSLKAEVLYSRYVALFQNNNASTAAGVRIRGQISNVSTSVNLRRVVGKITRWILWVWPAIKPPEYFDGRLSDRSKTQKPADIQCESKNSPLHLFAIFALVVNLCDWKLSWLFPKHIPTFTPIYLNTLWIISLLPLWPLKF